MWACLQDYLYAPDSNANGGGRLATVLVYATDVEEGDETVRGIVITLHAPARPPGFTLCPVPHSAYAAYAAQHSLRLGPLVWQISGTVPTSRLASS